MAKTKAEKAQEQHIEEELALFEEQGKSFRCRGAREQDIGAVVARIERTARDAERSAERKARQATVAKAAGQDDEAARHARNSAAQKHAAEQADALAKAVLEVAGKVKEARGAADGDVETDHVVGYLLAQGRRSEAAALDKVARGGCGADLAPTIAALPRPCDSEPYVCPRCGREGHASKTALAAVEE